MHNPEKLATLSTQKKQDEDKKRNKKHNTTCVGHHYSQTNTNNVNKTRALMQTIGGKDEPNIPSQHGTKNIKTHNRTTQKRKI